MSPALSVALVVVALLAGSALAADPPMEGCCACLPSAPVAMSEVNGPVPTPALFCTLIASAADETAFNSQCEALNGMGICVAPLAVAESQDNLDCDTLLADALNIECPSAPARPAPVLGHVLLGGLGALLAGLGMWSAARRRRRPNC
jgi:hypothetical protein